jgi:hypothetical protein
MKKALLFYLIFCVFSSCQLKFSKKMEFYSPKTVQIQTPLNEKLRVHFIDKGEAARLVNTYKPKLVHRPDKDRDNRPLYVFENGKVLHFTYIYQKKGHLYESMADFEKCNKLDYFGFAVVYEQDWDYYVNFMLYGNTIQELTQKKKYKHNSTYDSPIDECWEFEDGSVLFISKQHYNFGNWFASQEHFQKFYAEMKMP